MAKISVIVPVYNDEKYIKKCLNTITNQTLKDIEIICVDDGSTDNSPQILQEFAQNDNRIKVVVQKNKGAGAARNKGFEFAKGDYVIFFDSDDYMSLNCLEILYNTALKNNSDVTVCRSFLFEENNIETVQKNCYSLKSNLLGGKKSFTPQEISKYIFQFSVGWAWDKLYKRDFIKKNKLKFQNLRHSNDAYFTLMSLVYAELISYTDEYLIFHREHNNSLAHTRTKAPLCFYYALTAIMRALKKKGLYKIYEQSFVNYCVTFPRWHTDTIKDKMIKIKMISAHNKLLRKIKFTSFENTYYYDQTAYYKTLYTYNQNLRGLFEIFFVRKLCMTIKALQF